MQRIVQLTQGEYEGLSALAQINQDKINQKAMELYKQRGIVALEIDFRLEGDYLGDLKLGMSIFDRIRDYYDDNFSITNEDKKEIIKAVNNTTKRLIERSLSRYTGEFKSISKYERKLKRQKNLFTVFTITGWLMALTMMFYLSAKQLL